MSLEQLKGKTQLKRNFLMDDNNKEYKTLWPQVLKWAKEYDITGFGFSKKFIAIPNGYQQDIEIDPEDKKHLNVTEKWLIDDAHSAGKEVHVFTFRNEDQFLLFEYGQDYYLEFQKFMDLGIDGFFTDFPITAKRFLDGVCQESNTASVNHVNQLFMFLCLFIPFSESNII